tara:strand:- start:9745 stop:10596 length:852 start_codon:yes stop_codon:yes gene_type:complete
MIIWIASYPKSGNTWIRSFITSLLYSNDGTNDFSNLDKIKQFPDRSLFKNFVNDFQNIEEVYKNWLKVKNYINLDNKIKFLKTHHVNCTIKSYDFYDEANSLGTIHVVRDPRNVLISIKNHFSLNDFNEAKEFILKEKNWVGIILNKNNILKDNKIPTLISSWRINYLSWKKITKNYLLIKYEDLIKDPNKEFFKISYYLENIMNTKFEKNKILNAIKTSSFNNMQILEKKGLFKEYVTDDNNKKINFFNLGPKNDWKIYLKNEIVEEINFKFKNEMKELGYI